MTLSYLYICPRYVSDLNEVSTSKRVVLIQIKQNYMSLGVLWPIIWYCRHKKVIASLNLITMKFTDMFSNKDLGRPSN